MKFTVKNFFSCFDGIKVIPETFFLHIDYQSCPFQDTGVQSCQKRMSRLPLQPNILKRRCIAGGMECQCRFDDCCCGCIPPFKDLFLFWSHFWSNFASHDDVCLKMTSTILITSKELLELIITNPFDRLTHVSENSIQCCTRSNYKHPKSKMCNLFFYSYFTF